jgi:flagellar basal-body rod modification protein FlgD
MSTVSSATSSSTSSSTITNSSSNLTSTDFLSLLTTELENQDPLDPVDSTETVTQLAEYSELEALLNIEDYMSSISSSLSDTLSSVVSSTDYATGVSLLNQNVKMSVDSVDYDGDDVTMNINMGSNDTATVDIEDSDGNVVKTLTATAGDDGTAELTWNGVCDDGTTADTGTYTISIEGSDSDSSLYAYTKGTVTGVKSDSGTIMITVNDENIALENIMEVSTD